MLRMIGTILATLIFILLMALGAFSQGPTWKKEILTDQKAKWSVRYFIELPKSYCSVAVKKNGTGVLLKAEERFIHEKVEITKKGKDRFISPQLSFIGKKGGKDSYIPSDGEYSVFKKRCATFCNQLPKEIKEKFWGYYGIN